jgi:phosphopantothenoylcysteine decarboxylase/phosphopantothenate--cysteine ligase
MKKILITAGPTFEPIDPVRFIGNRSSGKQGVALANAFFKNGYEVFLILGPIDKYVEDGLEKGIHVDKIFTAEEMLNAALKYMDCDVAVHCAAVSDYKPEKAYSSKIKKGEGVTLNSINFIENVDVLATFCKAKNRPKLVIGFAAETDDLIENAKKKLAKKGCDYIIANDVSGGKAFGKDTNQIVIVGKDRIEEFEEMSKEKVAEKVVELVKNEGLD